MSKSDADVFRKAIDDWLEAQECFSRAENHREKLFQKFKELTGCAEVFGNKTAMLEILLLKFAKAELELE